MLDFLLIILPFLIMSLICAFQKDKKKYLRKFGILFLFGLLCSTLPFLYMGVFFGYYAYTINAAIIAAVVEFKEFK